MSKSDALFDLIKSLQQAEKRYFRITAQRHIPDGPNHYLELFDRMEKMESYEEARLQAQLSNPVFAKNLSSGKHYLYNLLLKSLRNYHSGKTAKIKLQELIIEIQILIDRELFDQAMKRIRKAEHLAQKFHYPVDLLSIMQFKRRIIRRLAGKKLLSEMEKCQQQSQQLLQQLQTDEEVLTTYEEAFVHYRIRDARRLREHLSVSVKQVQQKLEAPDSLSFDAACNSRFLLALHARVIDKNHQQGSTYLQEIVQLYASYPALRDEHQERYLNLLNNCFNSAFLNNDFAAFPDFIEKLRTLQPKTSHIRIKIDQSRYYYLLLFHLKTQQFNEATQLAPDIERFLKKHGPALSLDRQITFHYNIAVAYFSAALSSAPSSTSHFEAQLQQSLHKINRILNEPRFDTREDIKILSRLLAAIIHIELDQGFIAESILRSCYRQLHKRKQLQSTEFVVLQHLRRWLNAVDRSGQRAVAQSLTTELESVQGLEEVKLWLESAPGR
ncbi:MAG: hypothetical protein AAGG75_04130 [Bacteroidota bacterium]